MVTRSAPPPPLAPPSSPVVNRPSGHPPVVSSPPLYRTYVNILKSWPAKSPSFAQPPSPLPHPHPLPPFGIHPSRFLPLRPIPPTDSSLRLGTALVEKFSPCRDNIPSIETWAKSCRKDYEVTCRRLPEGNILFVFDSHFASSTALQVHPPPFKGTNISLRPWSSSASATHSQKVWLCVDNIPLHAWHPLSVQTIRCKCGNFVSTNCKSLEFLLLGSIVLLVEPSSQLPPPKHLTPPPSSGPPPQSPVPTGFNDAGPAPALLPSMISSLPNPLSYTGYPPTLASVLSPVTFSSPSKWPAPACDTSPNPLPSPSPLLPPPSPHPLCSLLSLPPLHLILILPPCRAHPHSPPCLIRTFPLNSLLPPRSPPAQSIFFLSLAPLPNPPLATRPAIVVVSSNSKPLHGLPPITVASPLALPRPPPSDCAYPSSPPHSPPLVLPSCASPSPSLKAMARRHHGRRPSRWDLSPPSFLRSPAPPPHVSARSPPLNDFFQVRSLCFLSPSFLPSSGSSLPPFGGTPTSPNRLPTYLPMVFPLPSSPPTSRSYPFPSIYSPVPPPPTSPPPPPFLPPSANPILLRPSPATTPSSLVSPPS
ncbi:hypothetical protein AMTRI_Chr09g33180 [Amborella trichopoda]